MDLFKLLNNKLLITKIKNKMSISVSNADEINLKILILGDSAVGKTTLLLKYVDGYFPTIYVATIGVEYKIKKITLNGININLQIWDTAGQERFRGITKNFLKGADGIVYTYDITNKTSFDNLKNWISTAEESITDFKKIIIGNKTDLEEKRQVSTDIFQKYCQKQNIKGFEVSAKNGNNVNESFELLAKLIIEGQTKEQLLQKYSEEGRARGKSRISKHTYNKKDKKKKC